MFPETERGVAAIPRKHKSRRKRRRGGLGRVLKPLSVLLASVAVVAALTLFFKVDRVLVTGCSHYTSEEVAAASGVVPGDNLVLLDKYRAAQRIYTELPYVSEVRLNRTFPDTLSIEITETTACAAIQGNGVSWLLDAEGKLLEMVEETAAADYFQIVGIQAVDPAIGQMLTLPDTCRIDIQGVTELLGELIDRNLLGRADSLDLSEENKVILNYDGRFQVEMFYDADFSFKLSCLEGIVEKLEPNERGIIRMTMDDENEVRFIPYTSEENG